MTARPIPVAIAGVTELRPGRYAEVDGLGLYRDVIVRAFADLALRPEDVDGLLVPPIGLALGSGAELFGHELLAEELGLCPRFALTINAGGGSYAAMLRLAAAAIRAGMAESVLCLGAGKYPKVGAGGAEVQARLISNPEFEFIYGPYIPAIYAIAATRYLAVYDVPVEHLASVAVSNREWALRTPDACMHGAGAITVHDVMSSRPIVSPFHLLDCSFPCEGGGAFLVTTGERARERVERPGYLLGTGEFHTHAAMSQARDLPVTGAVVSGRQAFTEAGLTPADIDVVELYDAFSINPLLTLEDLGFCGPGEAGKFVAEGNTAPGGTLPMNTNGGLLSFGHTGDPSGLSILVEGARQVMGTAAAQVNNAERVLVHTYGGMLAEHFTIILGGEPWT